MRKKIKHTPYGYFLYFYNALGFKLIINIFLAVLLGFFDGVGLALFIPLLQFLNDSEGTAANEGAMGGLGFIIDGFNKLGVPLNVSSVLLLILIIFSLKGLLTYILSMEQVDLRQKYGIGMRIRQLKEFKNLSYKGLLALDAGNIQNAMTVELGKNVQALNQFLATVKALLILSTYMILAFVANWQFALLIILGGALSNLLFKKINESVRNTSVLISKRGSLFSGYLIQCINSFKYLKSTNYFEHYYLKLEKVNNDVESMNRKIGKNQAITLAIREPIIILVVVLVILLQIYLMGASLGSIILSLLLFYRALNGLMGLQTSWQSFMQNVGSVDMLSDFDVVMKEYEEDFDNRKAYSGLSKKLELRDVDFSYGSKKVLSNISLSIEKNKTIAFVGESGSGKTTLANLLITLIHPDKGDYDVDDENLTNYNLKEFRNRLGYITQEPIIYNDTLFNNVSFWAEKTPENLEKFWSVMEKVALVEFIDSSEEKEDLVLGDSGLKISGGQKQRISIARELYKDIDLLVMDEATSALDSETENFIQDSIDKLKGKYTIIIIAHRLSTIKFADMIYLMDKGKIVAEGNFKQLEEISPKFKKMVELQMV